MDRLLTSLPGHKYKIQLIETGLNKKKKNIFLLLNILMFDYFLSP